MTFVKMNSHLIDLFPIQFDDFIKRDVVDWNNSGFLKVAQPYLYLILEKLQRLKMISM